MTEFWENHLHVPVYDDGVFTYRAAYGKLIRSHALGRFDEMLVAAITHPAMGISLDNATSTKRAPNENLGRELLELHTLGARRLRRGRRQGLGPHPHRLPRRHLAHLGGRLRPRQPLDRPGEGRRLLPRQQRPRRTRRRGGVPHLPGPAPADRRADRPQARGPVRLRHPSDALVDHLAQVYLDHDTAIMPVLGALVAHPEFRPRPGRKVRTPTDDVVATLPGAGHPDHPAVDSRRRQRHPVADHQHRPLAVQWGRPDGPPQDNRSWSSASRLLASFQVHHSMAGGWWPEHDMTYRTYDWLPTPGDAFRRLRRPPSHPGARQARARPPRHGRLRGHPDRRGRRDHHRSHPVVRWKFPLLLTTLLDTPDHLQR